MEVTVRPMREDDDIEQITDWFGSIGTEWLPNPRGAPRCRDEDRAQLSTWMRGTGGRSCVLVAETPAADEQPGGVIGFAVCMLHDDPGTDETYGMINGIFVQPDHRGENVGRTLKEAADGWCREAGATYMKARIGISNEAMLRVCRLLGYQPQMITMIRRFG